jgi:tripartite-type tricarboxylate transporter receptor subunit TctC
MFQRLFAMANVLAVLVMGTAAFAASFADAFPTRPVRFIVPYPPGGSTDPLARLIATNLTATWGQQVVVDNRAGGDTMIGTSLAAKAPPDGHTMLYHATTFVLLPLLHKHLQYDAAKDFTPVATVALNEKLLVVHPSVQANDLQSLISLAKANPGKLNFAMTANGSANHLANEMLNIMTGIRTVQVPYKGAGPALTDLVGGHVQLLFALPISVLGHVQRGALRAIAISGGERLSALPKVPTFTEAGLPKFEVSTWQGVLAPSRVPRAIVARISQDIAQALSNRDVREKMASQGAVPFSSTPDEFATLMKAEQARYARVIEAANIRL